MLAAPDDEGPRRVFADFCLERGDVRGELITLQCDLEHLERDNLRRAGFETRVASLLRANEAKWAQPVKPFTRLWVFRRGFVECVTMKCPAFLDAEALFFAAPIREVVLDDLMRPGVMPALARSPLLARLTGLTLGRHRGSGSPLTTNGFQVLARAARLGHLRSLGVWGQAPGAEGIQALTEASFSSLEALRLFGNRLGAPGASTLARAPGFAPRLGLLDLRSNQLRDAGAATLAEAGHFGRLRSLDLGLNGLTPAGARALASSSWVRGLESLELRDNSLGDEGLAAFTSGFERLSYLGLAAVGATPRGIEALANSPAADTLVTVDLSSNKVGEAGARALLASNRLTRLRHLKCAKAGITERTLAELTERFGREDSTG